MARDPPSLLAASELRDWRLEPSTILDARVTIIHPQLRDLIVAVERGRVLYPRGSTIEQLKWTPLPDDDEEDESSGPKNRSVNSQTSEFVKLNFTPNCLTGSRGMFAAGGQHGELHISSIAPSPRVRRSREEPIFEVEEPFRLDISLDTQAINNAITLLPAWPGEWADVSEKRRVGYVGARQGERRHEDEERRSAYGEEEDEDIGIEEEREDDDEAMDLDEDEEDEDGGYEQPLSPATYPNNVSFRHAVRIPIPASSIPNRRAASFSTSQGRIGPSQPHSSRQTRQSFSHGESSRPIRIVSSNPLTSSSYHTSDGRPRALSSVGSTSTRSRIRKRIAPEPRVLISSNDQSIRMLGLRQMLPNPYSVEPRRLSSYERESELARFGQQIPTIRTHYRPASNTSTALMSADWRGLHPVLPPPPPMMGSRFGWDSVGVNHGLLQAHRSEQSAAQRELRLRQIGDLEAAVGMGSTQRPQSSLPIRTNAPQYPLLRQQAPWSQIRGTGPERNQAKRAVSVGGKALKFPVNHSSFSPDLKTMISVGDSTDVQIFEVIDGGRDFRPITSYTAATDSGFSSAWSKDGRKFAVASQDGQVTVWDHRSSRPLATLFTSSAGSTSGSVPTFAQSPSFADDISAARQSSSQLDGWSQVQGGSNATLFNPVTGEPSSGASTSGREAARVVKFSPEGSSRDLMVFSEENTNIHIVDAKTFNTHVVIPVPHYNTGSAPTLPRVGVEGGECGIAGIAFDPTGEFLYSGTERTIVEWDMRRVGGGEGGTWSMA